MALGLGPIFEQLIERGLPSRSQRSVLHYQPYSIYLESLPTHPSFRPKTLTPTFPHLSTPLLQLTITPLLPIHLNSNRNKPWPPKVSIRRNARPKHLSHTDSSPTCTNKLVAELRSRGAGARPICILLVQDDGDFGVGGALGEESRRAGQGDCFLSLGST